MDYESCHTCRPTARPSETPDFALETDVNPDQASPHAGNVFSGILKMVLVAIQPLQQRYPQSENQRDVATVKNEVVFQIREHVVSIIISWWHMQYTSSLYRHIPYHAVT